MKRDLFQPMLSGKLDNLLGGVRYPALVSPKLDGVRCCIIDGVAMSRTLKPIPNKHVQQLFGKNRFNYLDGELIVGSPISKTVFQDTMSGVMSVEGKPDVSFYVFDYFKSPDTDFTLRLNMVKPMTAVILEKKITPVEHVTVSSAAEIFAYEEQAVELGYEGIMIRDPYGPYKYGRSTVKEGFLLKLKRFEDAEGVIVDFTPLSRNLNEATLDKLGHQVRSSKKEGKVEVPLLGSITVVTDNVRFEIGTGFTMEQRELLWRKRKKLYQRVVRYKYQRVGMVDKPRLPVFQGFRDEIDI